MNGCQAYSWRVNFLCFSDTVHNFFINSLSSLGFGYLVCFRTEASFYKLSLKTQSLNKFLFAFVRKKMKLFSQTCYT